MRWQIETIMYFSRHGKRRDLSFDLNKVNIISGDSGTGKSAVLQTIDYCLGSSECHIPEFIRRMVVGVAVMWKRGSSQALVARTLPKSGQRKSDRMKLLLGSEIDIPEEWDQLAGNSGLPSIMRHYQEMLGIGDAYQEGLLEERKRVTPRGVVPFIFLSKSVIDSETVLLHGFDDPRRRGNHERALPYFLGAVDEQSVIAAAEIVRLRRTIASEKRRLENAESQRNEAEEQAIRLLSEAVQVGLIESLPEDPSIELLTRLLVQAANWTPGAIEAPKDGPLDTIMASRERILSEIKSLEARRRQAKVSRQDAKGFSAGLSTQSSKLAVIELFKQEASSSQCPVCANPLGHENVSVKGIKEAYHRVASMEKGARRQEPQLDEYVRQLTSEIESRRAEFRDLTARQVALVSELQETQGKFDTHQRASRVAGRISYHLQSVSTEPRLVESTVRLEELEDKLARLEDKYGKEAQDEAYRLLDHRLSKEISRVFSRLPRVRPCDTAELFFSSKRVRLMVVLDDESSIDFTSAGSDENYLAIHVALLLGMQRLIARRKKPVPAILIVDQVSRPYFPPKSHPDEVELSQDDEETRSLRMHFDVLFDEVEKCPGGLQAIVLEHAYFGDDPRYVQAVRYRFSKTGEKLIPDDWPIQA